MRGGALALCCAVLLALRLGLTPRRWIQSAGHGVLAMWPAIRILVLAWAIGAVIRDIETGKYLSSLAGVSLPVWLLPAMLFVLAGLMAFATGTSWGTFGIMLPLAGDMVMHAEPQLLMAALAAVLAGAVFGDHCSPISDTTILSSTGAGCHHIDHVMTQLPYALLVASGALVAYIAYGLFSSVWLAYLMAGMWFALLFSLLFVHQRARAVATA